METYHAGGNRELCDDCPLRITYYEDIGDEYPNRQRVKVVDCAKDFDPDDCPEREGEEEE